MLLEKNILVKVIQLEKTYNAEHLLGKFLDDSSYDVLLNEDADVYRPLMFGETQNENTILLKFRKKVFTPQECEDAYRGLRSGATSTDNRGLAAGSERVDAYQTIDVNRRSSRRWVTKREKEVLDYFALGSPPSIFGDMAEEIYQSTPNTPLDGRGGGTQSSELTIKGGSIWIVKYANDIDFDSWFNETKKLSPPERKRRALDLAKKHISETTYGESVKSGVGGSMDRYPRIPFCRQTAWTGSHIDDFKLGFPLFERANQIYRENLPIRWNGQYEASKNVDRHFMVANTVYSTITINSSFRTACHRDAGDLCDDGSQAYPRGFSNLTVVTNGKSFDGFYLVFPEYRVAANIQNGDFIMMDAHKIHGNTPLKEAEEGFDRLSLVLYFRESITDCKSFAYEEARKRYVYMRKQDKTLPEWREGWNGISPGMFFEDKWFEYLRMNGLDNE